MNEFAMRRTWGPKPIYDMVSSYKRASDQPIYVAGPCSVESEDQIQELARQVSGCGATHLRGGLFRAGTYPGENFGWVNTELIRASYNAAKVNGLKNIVEILDIHNEKMLQWVLQHADCVQIGARQMQNYTLLRILGATGKQVFLKRHPGSTLDEWLGSAEYILRAGGHPVLVERGSVSHVNHVRWDLSISMIPATKTITGLPIIVDASHGTGRRDLVLPMTLAGVAAGADGCLVEVHKNPEQSLSDPDQGITPEEYADLMSKVKKITEVR